MYLGFGLTTTGAGAAAGVGAATGAFGGGSQHALLGGSLAVTGIPAIGMAVAGLLLVLAGLVLVRTAMLRRSSARRR